MGPDRRSYFLMLCDLGVYARRRLQVVLSWEMICTGRVSAMYPVGHES